MPTRTRRSPTPEPALLVLTSLASGPKHGYAVMVDVTRLAGVRLGPGTIYTTLARLEGQGLIERAASDDRRQPYQLTPAGREHVRLRLRQLQELAHEGLPHLEGT